MASPLEPSERLRALLDEGEAQALEEALARGALLLNDERRGRRVARSAGVPILGTAGLLLHAKRKGLLPAVSPALEALLHAGYRLRPRLCAAVRRRAGEDRL